MPYSMFTRLSRVLLLLAVCYHIVFCGKSADPKAPQQRSLTCAPPQFLNSARDACTSTCPNNEIKLTANDACVARAACAEGQILDLTNNTCVDFACQADEVIDQTTGLNNCITASACRDAVGKTVSADAMSCIAKATCLQTAGQVATSAGNCEVCTGSNSIRNLDKNACISESACQTSGSNANSVLDGDCITDMACMDMTGRVANIAGVCALCMSPMAIRNADKTACLAAAADCRAGAVAIDNDCAQCGAGEVASVDKTSCVAEDTGCTDLEGHVNAGGDCKNCPSTANMVSNLDKDACISAETCRTQSSNANSVFNDADCITDAACIAVAGRVASSLGVCESCPGGMPIRNADKTACLAAAADCRAGAVAIDNDCAQCGAGEVASVDKTSCVAEGTGLY